MGLIDEARHWWRMWSIRWQVAVGLLMAFACGHPEAFTGLVTYVPPYWRPLASTVASLTVFTILPAVLRVMKQRLPDGK